MDDNTNTNTHPAEGDLVATPIVDDIAGDTTTATANSGGRKWFALDTQKKKVAAGVGAGVLTFALGFGTAALVSGDGDGHRDGRRGHDGQLADGQQMPQQRGGRDAGGRGQRDQMQQYGFPQWGGQQWGGQQAPQQGQMPSWGPNSGTPSQSHGS